MNRGRDLAQPAFTTIRPRAVTLSQQELVHIDAPTGTAIPVVVRPAYPQVDLAGWVTGNGERAEHLLRRHGALLFRGFGIESADAFAGLVEGCSGPLLDYTYGSTPRRRVSGSVYTSTEYPADQTILLHNEMSYASNWPMRIWFCCLVPAETGGETPIADSRRVYARIPERVRRRFEEAGVLYVRNYGHGPDLHWSTAFQTHDRDAVEAFCRGAGIDWRWGPGDRLWTAQRCQASATHPSTQEPVWFNQAHLFHISSVPEEVRRGLELSTEPSARPRHACYGDGCEIEPEALDAIRTAYAAETIVFPWERGDLLLLDNMLVAHGRRPYTGSRRVVVAMSESHIP